MVGGVLSRLWTDCCRILVREKATDADGISRLEEKVLGEGIPCRLSYFQSVKHHASEGPGGMAAQLKQPAKIILPADVEVPAGSRIQLMREGRLLDFCASGQSMHFHAHQEIVVENFEKWA